MQKKSYTSEIDLIDVFQIILKGKFKILIFIIVSLIIAFVSQDHKSSQKVVVTATTKIKSISTIHEAEYDLYNSILKKIKPLSNAKKDKTSVNQNQSGNIEQEIMRYGEILDSRLYNMDGNFLLSLFLDKLNDRSYLINTLKKSNLINKENYPNYSDYLNSINSFASSINIEKTKKNLFVINATIYDKKKHESFLEILDREINNQIQKDLFEMFLNNIDYLQKLKEFRIEDIDIALNAALSQEEIDLLNKQKNILISNNYSERISAILKDSPISKTKNFYAARIDYNLTDYQGSPKTSSRLLFFVAGIFGALIGVFFVLIANAIQNRK